LRHADIVLTIDGERRRTRLFHWHKQAELVGAIADTRDVPRERVDVGQPLATTCNRVRNRGPKREINGHRREQNSEDHRTGSGHS